MRRLVLVVLFVAVFATRADAGQDTACWYRGLERIDESMSPPVGGDNQFFSGIARTPGVLLAFMQHQQTLNLPYSVWEARLKAKELAPSLPETGCTNAFFDGLSYALAALDPTNAGPYSPARSYQPPEYGLSGANSQSNVKGLFDNTRYYRYLGWDATCKSTGSCPVYDLQGGASDVCSAYGARKAECRTCIAAKGYWINPDIQEGDPALNGPKAAAFAGNWLNFYPPKHVLLRLALKKFVRDPRYASQNVRVGMVSHPGGTGASLSFGSANGTWNPSSCGGQGSPTTPVVSFLDALTFTPSADPIAEVLFGAGQYLSRYDRYAGTSDSLFSDPKVLEPGMDEKTGGEPVRGMCQHCNQQFVILFSDGRGDEGLPYCTKDPVTGKLPAPCLHENQCANDGMGPEQDGDDFVKPNLTPAISAPPALRTPPGTCAKDYADDVARFLYRSDLNTASPPAGIDGKGFAGVQNVITYVVASGADPIQVNGGTYDRLAPLEELAQAAGDGSAKQFFRASSYDDLQKALGAVFTDILRRSTSFSVASVTSVQTRGTTYAIVPRFRPDQGRLWEGHLFRFKMFNEFSAGCSAADTTPAGPGGTFTAQQLAHNPNRDTDCEDVYMQDANGNFIDEDDDGSFVVVDSSQPYVQGATHPWPRTSTPAVPVWDAAQRLSAVPSTTQRHIYTVVDSDGDGTFDQRIDFNEANLSQFERALALGGPTGPFCTALADQLNLAAPFTSEADCAAYLVRWIHGYDIFDQNGDGSTTDRRTVKILGDIFHSSPVLVTPPAPKFLCDLGVTNQCLFSLYGAQTTPMTIDASGLDAYGGYAAAQGSRDQFVLVGANDGLIHAFQAGTKVGTDYDLGTGDELWAFVSPDMLPKLKHLLAGTTHDVFVDGSPMVRDVWVDSTTNPGKKDPGEYHTVAVFGERQGGHSYVAFDVTAPADPKFLWIWPPVGSTRALAAGNSWDDFSPSAPPVVPVAVGDPAGPLTIHGRRAREVYAAILSGGYDPTFQRGRSVSMLDVWSGRPLWQFAKIDAPASDPADPRHQLFPIAAPVAALDTGPDGVANAIQDGIFDTAVVGDVAGQMWTFRFYDPLDDTDGDGQADNWFGARGFVQFKGQALAKRAPFFQLPAATVIPQNGFVRVYGGSGDRENIRQKNGGDCSHQNVTACLRQGCAVDVAPTAWRIGSDAATGQSATTSWATGGGTAASLSRNVSVADSNADASSCSDPIAADYTLGLTCGTATASFHPSLSCDFGVTTPGVDCAVDNPWSSYTVPTTGSPEAARFYSWLLFGPGARAPFSTLDAAKAYDQAALTDSDLAQPDNPTTPSYASASSAGYVLPYYKPPPAAAGTPDPDQQTASGTSILSGCVVWNTMVPDLTANVDACDTRFLNIASTYRAHFVTGAKNCGMLQDNVRLATRGSMVPPPAPTPIVALNPTTGQVSYSLMTVEPGVPPQKTAVGVSEPLGPIYWLEVPRELHECRHGTAVSSCR